MIVGLDIDGVLADFITPFLHLLAERTGTGPIDPVSVIDPNFIAHPFLTPTMIFDCMEAASYDAEFWRALTPLLTPKQWRELDRVSRTHQTVFITHRWVRDTYDINRVTCDWLRSHGVSNPVVYFNQKKNSFSSASSALDSSSMIAMRIAMTSRAKPRLSFSCPIGLTIRPSIIPRFVGFSSSKSCSSTWPTNRTR
jgi:hypothetical protein